MFDDSSRRSKAVQAALVLAQERGWNATSLADIAQRAGLGLADLRREFKCKSDILKAFQAEIDAEMLAKAKTTMPEQKARDRVFDMAMTRFEVMGPHKPALKRIACDLRCRPGEAAMLFCSGLASQYWMLAGAGIKPDGLGGALRVAGLAAVYARVFEVWLDDETPGLDRTMAALDRGLKQGELVLESAGRACDFVCGFMPRGWTRRGTSASAEPAAAGPNR